MFFDKFLRYKRSQNSNKGATMVEFAIVFPITLLTVMATFDFILYLVAKGTVERAAKQAAAYGAVVEGLEEIDTPTTHAHEDAVKSILDKAKVMPNLVLTKSLVTFHANSYQYVPPVVDQSLPSSPLDYRNIPIGVRITADYRPLLPFMPRTIEVSGFAYREKSEASSLPVPLDCLGRRFDPNNIPPVTSCPCPGANDALFRRQDLNSTACKCVTGADNNNPQNKCLCIRGDQEYRPDADACVCKIEFQQVTDPARGCECPDPVKNTVVGNRCECKFPYTGDPRNCQCITQCPTNNGGSYPQDPTTCSCRCVNPNAPYNPASNSCECRLKPEQCGEGEILENCTCTPCKANFLPDPTKTFCTCPLSADQCGGPQYFDSANCACTGICEFPDDPATPENEAHTSFGACQCNLALLAQRCGLTVDEMKKPEYAANRRYCNCPGNNCDYNDPVVRKSLEDWCGAPRPNGQGGIPVDYEHCGCKSGECKGTAFDLNGQDICVCSEEQKIFCKNQNKPLNPKTCDCETYTCPPQFLVDGVCNCSVGQLRTDLINYCKTAFPNERPVLDFNTCKCGLDPCPANQLPNQLGACSCPAITCQNGDTHLDTDSCRCVCEDDSAPIYCADVNKYVCFQGSEGCRNNPNCVCRNGVFIDPTAG